MDSLTQIVLGAAVGEAVLGKKIGTRAMLWGAIAGTIPDLDVLLRLVTDEITATEMHRGFSHSLVFSILFAPILAWIAHGIHKKKRPEATFRDWTLLFFLALVTHPLLDMHTTWGTQFFWPFEVKITYNNIFVVDPLYTIPFLVCLLIAMFYKRTNPKRRFFNNLGLIISTSYMALTFVFKGIGYHAVDESLAKQGIDFVEIETLPTPLNTILWDAHIETENGYRFGHYSLLDDDKPIVFSKEFPKNHHLIDSIRDNEKIQQILRIANGWYSIEKKEDHLIFNDLRFGQFGMNPNTARIMWQYEISEGPNGEVVVKRMRPEIGNVGEAFNQMWRRLKGDKSVEQE
ncbi:MAG: metal-dependent hydrolase [Flavobacteriales bacterium]|nr:metal-dependent hydrolase [Flavobacteriales bacterium]